MDAYNRGYNPGISDFSEVSDGSVRIGTATISFNLENADLTPQAIDAGFYAISYEWTNPETGLSETIISYRGTDNPLVEGPLVDYPIAFNDDFDEAQVHLASAFFQAVAGTVAPNTITTTGHSLGGALAGFVGALEK